jgi:hypothetical protein
MGEKLADLGEVEAWWMNEATAKITVYCSPNAAAKNCEEADAHLFSSFSMHHQTA